MRIRTSNGFNEQFAVFAQQYAEMTTNRAGLVNGDIDKVFLGNKRFTSLDVFQLFSCLSTKLHYFDLKMFCICFFATYELGMGIASWEWDGNRHCV